MSVLGIDQSHSATGIYHTSTDHRETISFPGEKGPRRVNLIKRRVQMLVAELRPQLVVLEGYDYGASHSREMAGEIAGVIKDVLYEAGYGERWCVVPPTSLKTFATGSHKASKAEMIAAAAERWGRKFRDDHQADAFWLSMLGTYLLMDPLRWLEEGLTRKQLEVLRKVRENPYGEAVRG